MRPGVWAAALALVGAALWAPRLRGPLDLRYDAGVYYVLGTALAEGKGYRLLNEPGAIEAVQYPPLLPAMAAAYQRMLGTADPVTVGHALRLSFAVLFVLYGLAVFSLGRRYVGPLPAFLIGLLSLLHVQTVFLSDFFTAELPYALATVLFALVLTRTPATPVRSVLAAVLGVAAFGLRTAGVALLAAWVGDAVIRRRAGAALGRAAVAAAAVLAWHGYTAEVKRSPEYRRPAYAYQRAAYQFYNVGYLDNIAYRDPFRPELGRAAAADFARRTWDNLRYVATAGFGEAVSVHRGWWRGELEKLNRKLPGRGAPPGTVELPLAGLSAAVLLGLLLLARRGHWVPVLYCAGSTLLICLTPWPGQFTRYLVPLTPFLLLGPALLAVTALERAARRGPRWLRTARVAVAGVLAVLLGQQGYTLAKAFTRHHGPATYLDAAGRVHRYALFFYDRTWRDQEDALRWLRERARPGEIVVTSTPHWAFLQTGLPAVMPPFEPDPAVAQPLLEALPASYLILDGLSFVDVGRRYTEPVLRAFPERWRLAYAPADSGLRVYRRVGGGPVVVPAATSATASK